MRTSRKVLVLAASALSALAVQAIAADAEKGPAPMGDASQTQANKGSDTGVTTTTFTVEKVDPQTRMVTLKSADGSVQEVKCGPEVRNFDQIKVGDRVAAAVTDDVAMDVSPGIAPAKEGEATITDRAPEGEKPRGVMIQSGQVAGKLTDIDPEKRMLTVQDASGKDKTIKVRPNLDMSQFKKGDEVTVKFTRATAIIVNTPQDQAQMAATTMPSARPATRPVND